jgi:hypothetical protein
MAQLMSARSPAACAWADARVSLRQTKNFIVTLLLRLAEGGVKFMGLPIMFAGSLVPRAS